MSPRAHPGPHETSDRPVILAFGALACCAVFLQKLGVNAGDSSVGLNLASLWFALGWLAFRGPLEIAPGRLAIFALMFLAMAIGIMFNGETLRIMPLGLLLATYLGLIFKVRVGEDSARRCLAIFQRIMLLIAAIVILQQLLQYSVGNRFWPNLDNVIPAALQYKGFAYIRPYSWNSPYLTPNGVFFLEPSATSTYLAIALVSELVIFRRPLYLAGLVVGLFACIAVSGFAILLLTLPLLALKANKRILLIAVAAGIPLIAVAASSHWLDPMLARSEELGSSNSSAYARIIVPLNSIGRDLAEGKVLTGAGPGASPKGKDIVQWPFSKLLYEYGLATAVLFHLFLFYCIFRKPVSRILSWAIIAPQLFFGGGFLSPANVLPLMLLCTLIEIVPSPPRDDDLPEGEAAG